jgi:hypothetical protein
MGEVQDWKTAEEALGAEGEVQLFVDGTCAEDVRQVSDSRESSSEQAVPYFCNRLRAR